MPESNFLLPHCLPVDAVHLGRLVNNVRYPEQDFFQSDDIDVGPKDIIVQELHDFKQTVEDSKDVGLKLYLSKLLLGAYSTQNSSKTSVSSARCITRHLPNSDAYLERICVARPCQFWLERAIRRSQSIYLVTGIKTVFDAEISDETSTGINREAKIEAPLTMAATGVGLPPSLDGILDVGMEANRGKTTGDTISFTAPGELIFAIQYRKLLFKRFSKKNVDDAVLEKGNRWKMYIGRRGEDVDDEDIVSVEVGDSLEPDDIGSASSNVSYISNERFIYRG